MNKVMMIILDGFGLSDSKENNAVYTAKTSYIDKLMKEFPHSTLKTSGLNVGLPDGIMGNSEVGHLNFGAGRIVYQLNTLIDKHIEEGSFYENQTFLNLIKHVKENNSKLHLFGLLSDGGVHSSMNHLWALLDLFKKYELNDVFYHAFMDGRDTYPDDGIKFMQQYLEKVNEVGLGKVASVSGRYYSMDRDNRWDRIKKAYDAIVYGIGEEAKTPIEAIKTSYKNEISDEFINPCVIIEDGKPIAKVEENDAILFFNFRADRAREITRTFIFDDFNEFKTEKFHNLKYASMTEYDVTFNDKLEVAFRTPQMVNILGEYLSKNNIRQIRMAETEKYAHVTFFFNGSLEKPFPLEDRILIPSPKVASYDLKPEMSAYELTEKILDNVTKDYGFMLINYANCDMVGHTGVFEAAVKAVETVDNCLERVVPEALKNNYSIIITADHGNAEKMADEEGNVFTAHSKNDVPFIVVSNNEKYKKVSSGILADVAPTILKIMGLEQPKEMTGKSLV